MLCWWEIYVFIAENITLTPKKESSDLISEAMKLSLQFFTEISKIVFFLFFRSFSSTVFV